MTSCYVLCFDPGTGQIDIVGAFKDEAHASAWGTKWQQEHDDSPCWNTILAPISVHLSQPDGLTAGWED